MRDRGNLTPREVSVLKLLSGGCSNREIGQSLSISEGTVKGHVHRGGTMNGMFAEDDGLGNEKLAVPPEIAARVAPFLPE